MITDSSPIVCRRCKSKGTPGEAYTARVSFEAGYVSGATFWCVLTGDATGPDDGFVFPHACVAGRACFTPPTDQLESA